MEPPQSFWGRIRFLGPSFVLSASIVGSGELIATTTLGAKAGFVTFWIILVSCMIKVAVQIEFGRHTIITGQTSMQSFSQLPGPVFGKARWSIWMVLAVMLIKLLQLGGIVGGVAIILNMVFPSVTITLWVVVVALSVGLLVAAGYYRFIERFSIFMIAFFTIFTFTSLFFLTYTDYAIQWTQVLSGLKFQLPPEAVVVAIGAFGITGVGADEIIHYNYWCLEKGYARYTGPRDDSEAWVQRAKGWIRVVYLDAILAMVVYTTVTSAFYLLGSAVLHARNEVPQGYEMIETLSRMYTESLGPGVKIFFLGGSFIVLFSTLFAALAAWTRQYADIFGALNWIDFKNPEIRKKMFVGLALILPVFWAILFIFIQLPVVMVISGGIVGSLLLFLVCHATYHFRYRWTPEAFKPRKAYDLLLWSSLLVITGVGLYGLWQVVA